MASNVVFNGVTYSIPSVGDSGWGTDLTAYFISISSNSLQKTGGNFTLTSEVNFGNTYGVKAPYLRSTSTNPAVIGNVRLANTDPIGWRNAANSADITLLVDNTDSLIFNGTSLSVGGSPVQPAITVTDTSTIDMTLAANNLSAIVISNSLTNSHINSAAAIAYSKLNLTSTIINADVNASAAIAYSKLNLATSIVNADINAAAAIVYSKLSISAGDIAYSKLNLTGSIVNADVNASAAIAYSKLNLATSIVNADVSSGAAIALTKLAPLGNNFALQSSGIGAVQASTVTSTELGYLSGVTSAIQTQIGTKITNPMTTDGDIIYGGASGVPTRLANGSSGQFLKSNGTTLAPTWGNPTIALTSPTVQEFLSGSGTYTTAAGVQWIEVEFCGGGSGGAGSGTGTSGGAGGAGGTTTFGSSLLTATGGSAPANYTAAAGGTTTISAPAIASTKVNGNYGQGGGTALSGQTLVGGSGSSTPLSGGGFATIAGPIGAIANTGSGGSGGGITNGNTGAGGSAAGYGKAIIRTPTASYAYAVGAGGAAGSAGTSGSVGAAGAAGKITVREYYQ